MTKTRTFRLNKLVRDRIVEHTEARDGTVDYEVLDGEELNKALVAKFIEEAAEIQKTGVSAEELADLQEIIDQLCVNLKIDRTELAAIQKKKREKNGGFQKGHYVRTVTLKADDKWAGYYASDPQKYPVITE